VAREPVLEAGAALPSAVLVQAEAAAALVLESLPRLTLCPC
jgi:hypothetical protein